MALERYYIDTTLCTTIAAGANQTYVHNLPQIPDAVFIQHIGAGAVHNAIRVVMGATRNTYYNCGANVTGNFLATSVLFHSMIR